MTTFGKVEKFQPETIEFPILENIPSDQEDEDQSAAEELVELEIAPPAPVEAKKRVRYKKN